MSPLFFLSLFFFSSPPPTTSVPIQLVSYPNGALVPIEPWRLPGAEVFEVVEESWRRKVRDGEVVQVEEHLLLDPSSRLARLLSQVVSCSISYQQKIRTGLKKKILSLSHVVSRHVTPILSSFHQTVWPPSQMIKSIPHIFYVHHDI